MGFDSWVSIHTNFLIHCTVPINSLPSSREGGDLLPYEHRSYVTAQLNSFKPDAGTDHFLVCGNPNMINDVYGLLKQKGFKAKQVVREKYVFARQEKVTGKASLTEAQKQLIAEKLRKYR